MIVILGLAGMSLVASMVFAAMGDVWGWFLWWALAIALGAVWAVREAG